MVEKEGEAASPPYRHSSQINIVEFDGSEYIKKAEYDVERSKYFESLGYPQGDVKSSAFGMVRRRRIHLHSLVLTARASVRADASVNEVIQAIKSAFTGE